MRPLFRKKELLLLLSLIILPALLLAVFSLRPSGTTALVRIENEEVYRVSLNSLKTEEIMEFSGENGIILTVSFSPGGARVVSSSCPDKICVRTGLLKKAGDAAVCVPARFTLEILGKRSQDAVTY